MTGRANLAASVAARLLNRARQTGDDHQALLTSYCLERFLYRLSVSDRRDRFALKGAMLLRLWSDQPYRATRDLDLLRLGDGAFEAIVVLGDRNSRIKDFLDLHHLASRFEFDRSHADRGRAADIPEAPHTRSRGRPDRAHADVLGESIATCAGARLRTASGPRGSRKARRGVPADAADLPYAGAGRSADRKSPSR